MVSGDIRCPGALVTEVGQGDPTSAGVVGGHRGEHMAPLGITRRPWDWTTAALSSRSRKPVVGGEHEAPHPGLAEQSPGRFQLLQDVPEHGRSDALLAGVVDFLAVHYYEAGLGDGALEGGAVAADHLL